MKVFAVDVSALLVVPPENTRKKKAEAQIDEVEKILRSPADSFNTREMNQWVLDGWVPSVVSSFDPSNRLMFEVWLSKNNVPYSNLIFGVDNPAHVCWQLDASFYVTANKKVAEETVIDRVYLLVDRWDSDTDIEGVETVRTFKNITEKEKK